MSQIDGVNICFPFVLDSMGGSYISTKMIAENLNSRYNCQFVFGIDDLAASDAKKAGLKTKVIPLGSRLSERISTGTSVFDEIAMGTSLMRYIWNIRQFLQDEKINVIHINDGLTAMLWGVAAKSTRIPVIWHVRMEQPNVWDWARVIICDHLIFVAESNKQRFSKKKIDKIRSSVIYNGVDLSSFSPEQSKYIHKELNIDSDAHIVGFVGNLVARKRPLLFANAAAEMIKGHQNLHCVMIGEDKDGYDSKISYLSEKNGISSRLHTLGYRADVPEIMPSFDLLLLTSTKHGEAFPRVPLEAMASGTPVVTTDTAGVSESVMHGKTGIVLKTDPSPQTVAHECLRLLKDENRIIEFRENGIRRARDKFSAEQYTHNIKEVYERIL